MAFKNSIIFIKLLNIHNYTSKTNLKNIYQLFSLFFLAEFLLFLANIYFYAEILFSN